MKRKNKAHLTALAVLLLMLPGCARNSDIQPVSNDAEVISETVVEEKSDETVEEIPVLTDSEETEETMTASGAEKISERRLNFDFDEGAENRGAYQVTENSQYSCRFSATAPFDSLALSCPSYSDNIG